MFYWNFCKRKTNGIYEVNLVLLYYVGVYDLLDYVLHFCERYDSILSLFLYLIDWNRNMEMIDTLLFLFFRLYIHIYNQILQFR